MVLFGGGGRRRRRRRLLSATGCLSRSIVCLIEISIVNDLFDTFPGIKRS
jgi:hypothetical protein